MTARNASWHRARCARFLSTGTMVTPGLESLAGSLTIAQAAITSVIDRRGSFDPDQVGRASVSELAGQGARSSAAQGHAPKKNCPRRPSSNVLKSKPSSLGRRLRFGKASMGCSTTGETAMTNIQIIGAPFSSYVWVVRMVCEEKRVPYDLVPAGLHSPGTAARERVDP